MARISEEKMEKLEAMYDYEVPRYVRILSDKKIQIRVAQWEGVKPRWVTITPKDVIEYYRRDNKYGCAGMSGIRTIADFSTDWRTVDAIAKEALEIFKIINRPALEREGRKHGMGMRD